MKIIEKFLQGKSPDESLCEDGLFVNEDFVVIVDGGTARSSGPWEGKKAGRFARDTILETLPTIKPDATAAEFMRTINEALREQYRKRHAEKELETKPGNRCFASVIAYSFSAQQIWRVGDCSAIVDGSLHERAVAVEPIYIEARSFYIESSLLSGMSVEDFQKHDDALEYIWPLIEKQYVFQNAHVDSPSVLHVIDGYFDDMNAIEVIDASSASEIVLASDGYPYLKPTLEESEHELHELLSEDPLLYKKYKAAKGLVHGNNSFDDRAYIRFSV